MGVPVRRADDRGATAVEYALIAGLIAVVALVGIVSLGRSLAGSYEDSAMAVGVAANPSPRVSASEASDLVQLAVPGDVVSVDRVMRNGVDSWAVTVERPDGSRATGYVDVSTGALLGVMTLDADAGAMALAAPPTSTPTPTPTPTPTRSAQSVFVAQTETITYPKATWIKVGNGNGANYHWSCANDFNLGSEQDVRSTPTAPGPAPDCG